MGAANSARAPEQPGGSDDAQLLLAFGQFVLIYGNHLRRMIKKEIEATLRTKEFELLLIQNLHTAIVPIVEDLFRKIAKEELQSAIIKNLLAGGNGTSTNTPTVTNERRLYLKFLGEVSEVVLTGQEIKGKGGTPIKVALVDEVTKQFIKSGPASSAKVEILLLEASEHVNQNNCSHQDFNSRIIKECDKTKPHFPKSYYVYLEEGTGEVSNVKLAHDSIWVKNCRCRLGARVVENLNGIKVHEAQSESFEVSDSRSKLYVKHDLPSLSDPVWRLVHIRRNGEPCKRLNKINVQTVRDFLFFLSVDAQKLQKVVHAGSTNWKAIVDHARSCRITDERICVYNDSAQDNMSVVFDVVGELKGVIHESQYISISHLSKARKDLAHKLLCSAFENQEGITYFSDERAFMHQLAYQGSFTATSTSILENFSGCNLSIPEDTNHCDPMERSPSSPRFNPSIETLNAYDPPISNQQVFSICDPKITEVMNHCASTELGTSSQGFGSCAFSMEFGIQSYAEAEKDYVCKALCSALEKHSGNAFHHNEGALMYQFPHQENYCAIDAPIQERTPVCDPTTSENINSYDQTESGISSQSIGPSIRPSVHENNAHMNQFPVETRYATSCGPNQDGTLGNYPIIPENTNHCHQSSGTSSQINSPTGPYGNAMNTLLNQVPNGTTYTATKTSIQEGLQGCDPNSPVSINHCESIEPGPPSQGMSPTEMCRSKRRRI